MSSTLKQLQCYTVDEISNLKRRELQTLCKNNGIKANSKNIKLIQDLQNKLTEITRNDSLRAPPNKKQKISNNTAAHKYNAKTENTNNCNNASIKRKKKRKRPSSDHQHKNKKHSSKTQQVSEKRKCRTRYYGDTARIERARKQRLFMINAKIINEFERQYAVLGSTGNVYTVTIGTLHSCTCYDCENRGNLCKHILFILIKVLRASNSFYIYQFGLLTHELQGIFNNAPQTLFGILAKESVRNKYKSIQLQNNNGNNDNDGNYIDYKDGIKRKELKGNDCPICMEEFETGNNNEAITWCRGQCGNNIHFQCFNEWKSNQERNNEDVVCVFCRVKWVFHDHEENGKKKNGKSGKRKKKSNGGYLNFADEQYSDL